MRVTVAYTVELEEVPSEVHRLLEGVSSGLTACDVVGQLIKEENGISDNLIKNIADLQEKLASIQSTLEDARGIARGYLSTISSEPVEFVGESDDNAN